MSEVPNDLSLLCICPEPDEIPYDAACRLHGARALLRTLEGNVSNCPRCGETHKTHPTRPGVIGWQGHTCRCERCFHEAVQG